MKMMKEMVSLSIVIMKSQKWKKWEEWFATSFSWSRHNDGKHDENDFWFHSFWSETTMESMKRMVCDFILQSQDRRWKAWRQCLTISFSMSRQRWKAWNKWFILSCSIPTNMENPFQACWQKARLLTDRHSARWGNTVRFVYIKGSCADTCHPM